MPHKHRILVDPRRRPLQQREYKEHTKLSNPGVLSAPKVYTFSLNQNMLWTEKERTFCSRYSPVLATHFHWKWWQGRKGGERRPRVPSPFSSPLLSRKPRGESVGRMCILIETQNSMSTLMVKTKYIMHIWAPQYESCHFNDCAYAVTFAFKAEPSQFMQMV